MAQGEGPLRDGFGRRIDYVRVSVTEECNYRCVFCMPADAPPPADAAAALTTAETLRLCRLLSAMGVRSFKVTGGEPFMNPEAVDVIAGLKKDCGAGSVTVTTNGFSLDRHARGLLAAGTDCVNVSMDGITPEVYLRATGGRGDVGRVTANVLLARGLGLNVKLNVVPVHGLNDADVVPILEFALRNGVSVRFIELMPLGEGRNFRGMTRDEVRRAAEERFGPMTPVPGRLGNGPAAYCRVSGHEAMIGYIAALSANFCAGCNRVRLTSAGFFKTCLHSGTGVDLAAPMRAGESDAALAARVREAVLSKPERHRFGSCPAGGEAGGEPMFKVGG